MLPILSSCIVADVLRKSFRVPLRSSQRVDLCDALRFAAHKGLIFIVWSGFTTPHNKNQPFVKRRRRYKRKLCLVSLFAKAVVSRLLVAISLHWVPSGIP